jgi:hypothetical protein
MRKWRRLLESAARLTYHAAMGRLPCRPVRVVALAAALLLAAGPACAQDAVSAATAGAGPAPAVVLARLADDPHTPEGYSATLELHAKLRSFPFIGLTVHGTSSYRKPGLYHYQLQNLPRIAAKFDDLHYDLGDPTSWAQRYDIAMAPESSDDAPILRLTPKKPGLVMYLDIETDAKRARMLKATWKRHDGGTIVLTQSYTAVGFADVVTQQHATIDIPHMRADVTATYTNIAVDSPMFATVPDR